jgi:uncharacterized protein YbaA (DUF1428 family)
MGKYVDGFVLPVPKANLEAYRHVAEAAGKVWREYGALAYTECVADDVKPGRRTSFPQSVKLKPDETVVLAWIVYESREQRDRVNERVVNDPSIANMDPKSMPFDTKRMFWGGFRTFRRYLSLVADRGMAGLTMNFGTTQPEGRQGAPLDERPAHPRIGELRAARALLEQLA